MTTGVVSFKLFFTLFHSNTSLSFSSPIDLGMHKSLERVIKDGISNMFFSSQNGEDIRRVFFGGGGDEDETKNENKHLMMKEEG